MATTTTTTTTTLEDATAMTTTTILDTNLVRFFLLGVGTLLPFNVFITAKTYFDATLLRRDDDGAEVLEGGSLPAVGHCINATKSVVLSLEPLSPELKARLPSSRCPLARRARRRRPPVRRRGARSGRARRKAARPPSCCARRPPWT